MSLKRRPMSWAFLQHCRSKVDISNFDKETKEEGFLLRQRARILSKIDCHTKNLKNFPEWQRTKVLNSLHKKLEKNERKLGIWKP